MFALRPSAHIILPIHSGAGVLVELPSGGEALLMAEDREEYYGFDESDFPDPSSDGRVMMLLSYP